MIRENRKNVSKKTSETHVIDRYLVLLANQEQTGKAVFFIFDGDFFGCGEKRGEGQRGLCKYGCALNKSAELRPQYIRTVRA